MKVPLSKVAYGRSGDKGAGSNVGVVAYHPAGYEIIRDQLTAEAVKAHFHAICFGKVERFELPNLLA